MVINELKSAYIKTEFTEKYSICKAPINKILGRYSEYIHVTHTGHMVNFVCVETCIFVSGLQIAIFISLSIVSLTSLSLASNVSCFRL